MSELSIKDLSDSKVEEIQGFVIDRFNDLRGMRDTFDSQIKKDIEIYNAKNDKVDDKAAYEQKYQVPFTYSLTQTIIARVKTIMFGAKNFLKMYVERDEWSEIEKELTLFLQAELDKIKLKSRSRDFIEDGIVKRLSWLHIRPVPMTKEGDDGQQTTFPKYKIDFDILDFFDVWFDVKAKDTNDTDFAIRKLKKFHEIRYDKNGVYHYNLDKIKDTKPSHLNTNDINRQIDEFQAKHRGNNSSNADSNNEVSYYDINRNDVMADVEIIEWYGKYDMADKDNMDSNDEYMPEIKDVLFTLVNRSYLIRAEIVDLPTSRKNMMFPIRPMRQSNSLIGKGIPQLVGNLQRELDESRSLRMDNFRQVVKLLFKYDKNANINLSDLHAGAGNAIGLDDMNALDIVNVPNVLGIADSMGSQIQAEMQQITGAVDSTMGMQGSGTTASEVRTATDQAMFKFSMIADNIYDDVLAFINYVMILHFEWNGDYLKAQYPKLYEFIDQLPGDLENSYIVDIELKDLSQRRDVERNQWVNMIGVIEPMLEKAGGNTTMLLKKLLEVFDMSNIEAIMKPEDAADLINKLAAKPDMAKQVMEGLQQLAMQEQAGGTGDMGQPRSPEKLADPVEVSSNENVPR